MVVTRQLTMSVRLLSSFFTTVFKRCCECNTAVKVKQRQKDRSLTKEPVCQAPLTMTRCTYLVILWKCGFLKANAQSDILQRLELRLKVNKTPK